MDWKFNQRSLVYSYVYVRILRQHDPAPTLLYDLSELLTLVQSPLPPL